MKSLTKQMTQRVDMQLPKVNLLLKQGKREMKSNLLVQLFHRNL